MDDALGGDGVEVGAVDGAGPASDGGVGDGGLGGGGVAKDVGPLLDGLVVVVVVDDFVAGAVVDGDLGTGSVVAWVSGADEITPLLGGLGEVAVGAVGVPHAGGGEAAVWDTGEGSSSLEEVWVGSHEDLGHHSTGGGSGGIDTGGVDAVCVDGVANEGGDTAGISSSIVREGGGGSDIPAPSGVWGLWVDDDELVDIGKVLVGSVGVVGVGGTSTVMGSYEKSWVGSNIVRNVDVETDIVGVGVLGGVEVGDLGELGSEGGGGAEKDRSQSGEAGGKFNHC